MTRHVILATAVALASAVALSGCGSSSSTSDSAAPSSASAAPHVSAAPSSATVSPQASAADASAAANSADLDSVLAEASSSASSLAAAAGRFLASAPKGNDAEFATGLNVAGVEVTNMPDAIAYAHDACAKLSAGVSYSNLVFATDDNAPLKDPTSDGRIGLVATAIAIFCPENFAKMAQ